MAFLFAVISHTTDELCFSNSSNNKVRLPISADLLWAQSTLLTGCCFRRSEFESSPGWGHRSCVMSQSHLAAKGSDSLPPGRSNTWVTARRCSPRFRTWPRGPAEGRRRGPLGYHCYSGWSKPSIEREYHRNKYSIQKDLNVKKHQWGNFWFHAVCNLNDSIMLFANHWTSCVYIWCRWLLWVCVLYSFKWRGTRYYIGGQRGDYTRPTNTQTWLDMLLSWIECWFCS